MYRLRRLSGAAQIFVMGGWCCGCDASAPPFSVHPKHQTFQKTFSEFMVVYAYMYKVFFTPNVQNITHFRHLLFEQTHSSGILFNHWSYLTYVVMYCTYNTGHSHLFILFFFEERESQGDENGRTEDQRSRNAGCRCVFVQYIK